MAQARSTDGRAASGWSNAVSGAGRLTAASLVLFALSFVYVMVVLERAVIPPLLVFTVVSLLIAAAVMRGWAWAPLVASLFYAAVFAMSLPIIVSELGNPAAVHDFAQQSIRTLIAAVGFLAGIAATVGNLRSPGGAR